MAELIPLPIDADVAAVLASDQATRLISGALVSGLVRATQADGAPNVLMAAIGQVKITAHRNGLTDALLDDELRHDAAQQRQSAVR